jgi:hypothetical protein
MYSSQSVITGLKARCPSLARSVALLTTLDRATVREGATRKGVGG